MVYFFNASSSFVFEKTTNVDKKTKNLFELIQWSVTLSKYFLYQLSVATVYL